MGGILEEMRYAVRQLRRSPGFSVIAVATLALGIGATTAVFSLVDTVLLRPLPFAEAERLVALDTLTMTQGGSGGTATVPAATSYPNFRDWRDQARSFTAMASWQGASYTLGERQGAERIDGMVVSADFLRVLGVQPALGRGFDRAEEQAGNRAVLLSDELWRTVFHRDPKVLGRTIELSDESYVVVGVMPEGLRFPNAPDAQVWASPALSMEGRNPSGLQRGWNQLSVLGRLAPGVSLEQARAEMQAIQRGLAQRYADDNANETAVSVTPALEDLTGEVKGPLRILFGAVCSLLLIACANVAGLLLTRTTGRRGELALRAALGASRMAIARQLLLESLMISLLGGVSGFALAAGALQAAPALLPAGLPRMEELSLNPRLFAFALGAALVTGLLFGVVPAWRSARLDPAEALGEQGRGATAGRRQGRLHGALVIGEMAVGLMLLVSAGLLMRSFDRVLSVDPGFNVQHLLTFRLGLPAKRFTDERLLAKVEQLQARFSAMPGVIGATYGFPMPLEGSGLSISFSIAGRPVPVGSQPSALASVVAPNFFSTMQIGLRRGRWFTEAEGRARGPAAILVNRAFAEQYFPGEDAVGKRMASDLSSDEKTGKPIEREIVGVVEDVHRVSLTAPDAPEYYLPFGQATIAAPVFALRVAGEPAAYVAAVRAAVSAEDATLPVYAVRTNVLRRTTAEQRFQTLLLSGFAVLALLLSAIGLYAVVSYMAAQRRVEMGLRLALGAARGDVMRLVLRRGLLLSAAGLVLGLGASALATQWLRTVLFHTAALDPLTFVGMTGLLLVVAVASCLGPAWRASRVNPNETLRQQ